MKETAIPPPTSQYIFCLIVPGRNRNANLKNVMENQYRELKKVACSLELYPLITAKEGIQLP